MVEVETTLGVPDGIVAEVKKKYADEKQNDIRVTKSHPLNPPYYAWGDPRSKYDVMKFEGKEYWVWAMAAMLALMATETVLGQRFGHYRK